jgi:reactive intermediate/imine deaminase
MSGLQIIRTESAPPPAGHYSQAVFHAGVVYVSGLLAVDLRTRAPLHGDAAEQLAVVVRYLTEILHAAGSDLAHVLKTTVYISNIEDWKTVNTAYAALFGDHRPARTIVPVATLHYGLNVEMDAIAALVGEGR